MDLEKVLLEIELNTSQVQLEKLRLLVSAVIPFGLVESKSLQELFRAIDKSPEVSDAVILFRRFLSKTGLSQAQLVNLTPFMTPAQERGDLPRLYFHELLIEVADHVGDGEFFKRLRNRVPRAMLNMVRDDNTIPNCVRLLQILLHKNVFIVDQYDHQEHSLSLLEEWLTDIGRKDVAMIVERRKREIGRLSLYK